MERWEELYSNGAINIKQYAEWLIREGKLPSDLCPESNEAFEAVMRYREENRIKLSISSYDVMGNELDNQLVEVQAFFNKIKPLIIGKPVKQILSSGFYLPKESNKEKFNTQYWKTYTEGVSKKWIPNHVIRVTMGLGDLIFLEIGEQQLEFELWAPWQFSIKLNSFLMRQSFNVEGKTVEEVSNSHSYKDISCLYGDELIGQKIIDIDFITDDTSVVEFVFKLENGNELHLYEDVDEPIAELHINSQCKTIASK